MERVRDSVKLLYQTRSRDDYGMRVRALGLLVICGLISHIFLLVCGAVFCESTTCVIGHFVPLFLSFLVCILQLFLSALSVVSLCSFKKETPCLFNQQFGCMNHHHTPQLLEGKL